MKEPRKLLFFRGAIYEITFNRTGHFANTQLVILYDLPSAEDVINWKPIKVLKYPIGLTEVEFDANASKQFYLDQGFVEVSVGVANQYSQSLAGNIQAKRKQYGLKHRVTLTI